MVLAGVISQDGVIDGALAARSQRIEPVGRTFAYVLNEGPPRLQIYQTDVRAIQLAKAALYAGAKLLIERRGGDAPQRITLAGAFGAQIDPLYAMTLGLIPDCDLKRVASAGNAAGTGARIALLNLAARAEIESVVRRIEKIETAIEPNFQDLFVAAMAIPNKTDAFPNLAREVDLPAPQETTTAASRRRRRAAGGDAADMPTLAQDVGLAEAMARLDTLTDWERRPRRAMRVGLAPMLDLSARLGDPHRAFRSVHVAGTKGKGSVSALIEAALARAGIAAGRYGSPHVERVNERVSLGGRDVDDRTLAAGLTRALDAYEAARRERTAAADATWFDLLTAAAFLIFARRASNGRRSRSASADGSNSTNIVEGEIAVVTNIGLEHTEILGATRAAIAGEKVGILKPGAVLVDDARSRRRGRPGDSGSGRRARLPGGPRRSHSPTRRSRRRTSRSRPLVLGSSAEGACALAPASRSAHGFSTPETRIAARLIGTHGAPRRRRSGPSASRSCSTARMCHSISRRSCAISGAFPNSQAPASRWSLSRPTRTPKAS